MNGWLPDLRKSVLVLALAVCVFIAFMVILSAKEGNAALVISDMRVANAAKAVDVLEQQNIRYRLEGNYSLYADVQQITEAKIALQNADVVADFPEHNIDWDAQLSKPLHQQIWFFRLLRVGAAALVLIILIVVVFRPMTKDLIRWVNRVDDDDSSNEVSVLTEAEEASLHQTKRLKQATVGLALLIVIGIVSQIAVWLYNDIDMSPLMSDMKVADAAKITDTLNQHEIHYRMDMQYHMLFVDKSKRSDARVALARVGIVQEYPQYKGRVQLPSDTVEQPSDRGQTELPVYMQLWFLQIIRLVAAALVIIVLIQTAMKPMLRALIYPEDSDGE